MDGMVRLLSHDLRILPELEFRRLWQYKASHPEIYIIRYILYSIYYIIYIIYCVCESAGREGLKDEAAISVSAQRNVLLL